MQNNGEDQNIPFNSQTKNEKEDGQYLKPAMLYNSKTQKKLHHSPSSLRGLKSDASTINRIDFLNSKL